MGNSLRCCLACVLPCGALDLVRIVHLNGYVEEITHPITAGEILKANPNHILSKPCSHDHTVVRQILILSPETQLRRGSIYFLIPDKKKSSAQHNKKTNNCENDAVSDCNHYDLPNVNISETKHKHCSRKDRRRHLHWRPYLAIISEAED